MIKLALALTFLVTSGAAMALPIATCPALDWNDAKTANPSKNDIYKLNCWTKAGEPGAGFILAMLTRDGRGVPADPVEARRRLTQLAKGTWGGDMTGTMGARTRSYNMDPNGAAAEELQVAPYVPAMRELAKMQLLGKGGDKDVAAALGWLEKARATDKEAAILYDALKAKGY